MNDFLDFLQNKWNVDLIIVVIVLLSGFFQKSYLTSFTFNKNSKVDSAWKTLSVSLIISVIWIWLSHRGSKDPLPMSKYFFSYFVATSLYELIIDPFKNWIIQKFNLGQSTTNQPTSNQ